MAATDARRIALDVAQQRAPRIVELAVSLEHHPPLHEVSGRVDEDALGFESVAAGTSRFLLVVLERLRRASMHDEAHIRTIDAHAESDGCNDDVGVLVEEGILVAAALGVGEAGVIGLGANAGLDQPRRQRVDFAPRGAVDDARLAAATGHHIQNLALQAGARQHAIDQVRAIERPDELERRFEAQLRRDVAAYARRRGGGIRVKADAGQHRPQPSELSIFGTEVVPPLADAVRFVDRDELHVALGEAVDEPVTALPGQAFRGYIEQPDSGLRAGRS